MEPAAAVSGKPPTPHRDASFGENIGFALGRSSLGSVLVASSAAGLVAILIGDDPAPLVRDLQGRLPKARLVGDDAACEASVSTVLAFLEAPARGLDLPLDIRGTLFQQRVWSALRAIPAGRTVSYAELARAVGLPGAVRAVAGACAANSIAVAIPCHRVVRSDGSLSGYRWGVARKRLLLAREAQAAVEQ